MIIRTRFRRGEEVKYISHLDLMKVFERAIRRSRLPIAYSQGFNPHPGMVFGLPLGVGVTSDAEYADFEVTDETLAPQQFMSSLNEQLPRGLELISARRYDSKQNIMATISASHYNVVVGVEKMIEEKTIKDGIKRFMALPAIMVEKRTKSGNKEVDIKSMIFDLDCEVQQLPSFSIIKFSMLVSAGSKANLKPDLLTEAFMGFMNMPYEIEKIHRTKLFISDNEQLVEP